MAKAKTYRLCTLKNENTYTTGYIEEYAAVKGYRIELVEMPMEGLWEVISVAGGKPTGQERILNIQNSQRNHRSVTDI
jgi:hypothetical protein